MVTSSPWNSLLLLSQHDFTAHFFVMYQVKFAPATNQFFTSKGEKCPPHMCKSTQSLKFSFYALWGAKSTMAAKWMKCICVSMRMNAVLDQKQVSVDNSIELVSAATPAVFYMGIFPEHSKQSPTKRHRWWYFLILTYFTCQIICQINWLICCSKKEGPSVEKFKNS